MFDPQKHSFHDWIMLQKDDCDLLGTAVFEGWLPPHANVNDLFNLLETDKEAKRKGAEWCRVWHPARKVKK